MIRVSDTEFAALDLETTGLDLCLNRIVEVGAVIYKGETVLDVYETLVDPGVRIHPRLTAIHGITNRMVKGAPSPFEAVSELEDFIGDRPLVIQNAPFDLGFIEAVRKEHSDEPLSNAVFDTCRLAPLVFPGLLSYRLGPLARALGIVTAREHRAVDDALAAMGVFLKCVERVDPQGEMEYALFKERCCLQGLMELERSSGELLWPDGSELLKDAWERSLKIFIVYRSGSGTTTRRMIAPMGLVRVGGGVMLEAWCDLRQENRTFRFDRILEVRPEKKWKSPPVFRGPSLC
ncbi:MAG: exonuclease domain-containing protein [Thermovirgaceae bacterium]|nr:exonuclease domain-containing protein [Thermovirgaceae bacterium]